MKTELERMDGEALAPSVAEADSQAPVASLAPGVESLPEEEEDEGVPWEEQEDPAEGRDLPGLTEPQEEEDEEAEEEAATAPPATLPEGESDAAPPPEPDAPPAPSQPGGQGGEPPSAGGDSEARESYWRRVMTGNPDTVPGDVRARAGADDVSLPEEERDYRMLATINRSWVADHSDANREDLKLEWPQHRSALTSSMGVADSEMELFIALSKKQREAPRREAARAIYEKSWRAGVLGQGPADIYHESLRLDVEDLPLAQAIAEAAHRAGEEERQRHLPLAEKLAAGLDAFSAMEEDIIPAFRALPAAPELAGAIDELAEMEPQQRSLVYAMAQGLMQPQLERMQEEGLLRTARRALRRGAYNAGMGVLQLLGNTSASMLDSLGQKVDGTLGTNLAGAGHALDHRTQVLEELRHLYQGEMMPLEVGEEAGLAGQMLVDAAGVVPAAVASCCGGAGFASLWASSAGELVAEARRLAPEGEQKLQLAAGLIGSAIQAGIFMGMGAVGGRMLESSIARFARAGGTGVKGYSLAALRTLEGMSLQSGSLLLAGKLADAAGKSAQELAARLGGTASNIDWKAYGDNIVDIELNMREAAMTLPFVLIGSGHVALRHFLSPRAVLGEGRALADWGIDAATRKRIMKEVNIDRQGILLREALAGSRRWSAPGFILEAMKALRLLNTDYYQGFREQQVVADFLRLPSQGAQVPRPPMVTCSAQKEADVQALVAKHGVGEITTTHRLGLALQLWDEWWQKAHLLSPLPGTEGGSLSRVELAAQRRRFYHEDLLDMKPAVNSRVRAAGAYAPQAEAERMALLRDRVAEATDLSYQMLLHTHTLDSLSHNSMGIERLRNEAERTRKSMLGAMVRSVVERALGREGESSLAELGQYMADYVSRRSTRSMSPNWLRRLTPPFLRRSAQRARDLALVEDTGEPLELQELYRVELGMLSCANALYELLPLTPDFQTALSRGMAPAQAYAHLLGREFELDLARVDKFPHEALAAIDTRGDAEAASARHEQDYEHYSMLTGSRLESVVGEDGSTYWRVRRPNGRYTHWHGERAQAINDMVANTALSFLPAGVDVGRLWQQRAGEPSFDLGRELDTPPLTYTAFDRLSNIALSELTRSWLETGTGLQPGFGRAELQLFYSVGGSVQDGARHIVEESPEGGQVLTFDALTLLSPLSMVRARLHTYWWRQLCSGMLQAEEAGNALSEYGFISADERQRVLDLGKLVKPHLTPSMPLNTPPVSDVPGMHEAMACHLTDMSLAYLMRHLETVPLPASVREWFATAALSPLRVERPERALRLSRAKGAREIALWANRLATNELRELAPQAARFDEEGLAERLLGGVLGDYLNDALGRHAGQGYEQAWCLTRAGREFIPAMPQESWELMLHPARAWERLSSAARERLVEAIGELCRREPSPEAMDAEAAGATPDYVESALHNLAEVLKEYPELHAYDLERGNELRVRRLVPDEGEARSANLAPTPGSPEAYRPDAEALPGFTLSAWEPAPAFMQEDSRVLPALTLLGALRGYATGRPFAWDGGIQWQGEQYGNVAGRRPAGVDESWKSEQPMLGLLEMLDRLDALAANAEGKPDALRFCGVELAGFPPGTDLSPLTNITIYRDPRNPAHIVRLMPGERNAANEDVRTPYVVHSAAGAYMDGIRTMEDSSRMEASFVPLERYRYRMPRISLSSSIEPRAAQHAEHTLNAALSSTMRMAGISSPVSGIVSMRELLLRFVEDTGFAEALRGMEPHELDYGQLLTLSLARRMLDCVCGADPQAAYREYVRLCHRIRRSARMRGEVLQTLINSAKELFDMGDPLRKKYIRRSRGGDYERRYNKKTRRPVMTQEDWQKLREWSQRNRDY